MLVIRHNSAYGSVPGLFSPYKIGLDAQGYTSPYITQFPTRLLNPLTHPPLTRAGIFAAKSPLRVKCCRRYSSQIAVPGLVIIPPNQGSPYCLTVINRKSLEGTLLLIYCACVALCQPVPKALSCALVRLSSNGCLGKLRPQLSYFPVWWTDPKSVSLRRL